MKTLYFALTLATLHFSTLGEQVRYDDHKVFRLTPRTKEAVEALIELEKSGEYDFWTRHFGINQTVDINAWLESLAEENQNVQLINGGTSYLGKTITGVRLSFINPPPAKKVIVESNIHAREWITSAVATWIINEFLTSSDASIRELAASREWYIFPVVNPDGFEYSHVKDRLWRKTRVPYGSAYGADPNRNWDYFYNGGGASSLPSSETYRGPFAFSEPSTRSLSQYISSIVDADGELEAYISLHSYSQLLLLPYGHTDERLQNYNETREVGEIAIARLAEKYGTTYQIGNIAEILYYASGGSMDWVKGIHGTRIVYSYELRDTGEFGFLLPPNQIIPTAEETWDSFVTIFQEFDRRPLN